jgi:hypothetical protein
MNAASHSEPVRHLSVQLVHRARGARRRVTLSFTCWSTAAGAAEIARRRQTATRRAPGRDGARNRGSGKRRSCVLHGGGRDASGCRSTSRMSIRHPERLAARALQRAPSENRTLRAFDPGWIAINAARAGRVCVLDPTGRGQPPDGGPSRGPSGSLTTPSPFDHLVVCSPHRRARRRGAISLAFAALS